MTTFFLRIETKIIDEESPSESDFPTYIEVQKLDEKVNDPWYDVPCLKPWFFSSQHEDKDVNSEVESTESVSREVPVSSEVAPNSDKVSVTKSKNLSETLSVFPQDLQTLSGESDTEKNQQPLYGWDLCGGNNVEHSLESNNATNSYSLEDQNRVAGTVWGQKPSDDVVSKQTI